MDTKKLTYIYIYIYIYTFIFQNNWPDPFPRPPTPPKKRKKSWKKKFWLLNGNQIEVFSRFSPSLAFPTHIFPTWGRNAWHTPKNVCGGGYSLSPSNRPNSVPYLRLRDVYPSDEQTVTTPLISTSLCLPSVHAELQESSISRLSQSPLQRFLQSADKIINDEGTQRHQYNPKSLSSSRFNGKNAFKKKIYIYILFSQISAVLTGVCAPGLYDNQWHCKAGLFLTMRNAIKFNLGASKAIKLSYFYTKYFLYWMVYQVRTAVLF